MQNCCVVERYVAIPFKSIGVFVLSFFVLGVDFLCRSQIVKKQLL